VDTPKHYTTSHNDKVSQQEYNTFGKIMNLWEMNNKKDNDDQNTHNSERNYEVNMDQQKALSWSDRNSFLQFKLKRANTAYKKHSKVPRQE
jgi:hypothetical protein